MKLTIYFLFLIILLIFYLNSPEGFNLGISTQVPVGKYDYLKPHEPAVLTTELENKFIELFNKNATSIIKDFSNNSSDTLKECKKYATVDEFEYYVKNNKWPYGSYIIDYITSKDKLKNFPVLKSIDDAQKIWASRAAYQILIALDEGMQSPQPLSYEIFTGKKEQPSGSPLWPT